MKSDASTQEALSSRQASMGEVVRLAMPIIWSMLSMSLLGLVDTFFMRWVGPAAQAAIGLGAPSTFSILSFFLGILSGLTTFVSQYYGAGRHHDCGRVLWLAVSAAIVFSLISILALIPLTWELLVFMNTNPDIIHGAFDYMRVRIFGAPIYFVSFTFLSFLRGLADMKTPAVVSVIVVLINIPLTYIFTFGFGPIPAYGITGAAIGTVLAQVVEMSCYMFVVLDKKHARQFNTRKIVLPAITAYKTFFKVSLPIGISWAIEQIGWLFFSLYIGSLDKESAAAHAIVQVFMNLAFMPGLAISIAAATLVGQYMGAKNVKTAEQSAKYSMYLGIGCLVTLGVLIFLFRYPISELFSDDSAVIAISTKIFCFAIVYQVFDAVGVTTGGALRGAGDTRFPMVVTLISMWVIMVPAVLFLGDYCNYGVYGAWVASIFASVSMGCANYARFRSGKWKSMTVD